MALSIPRPVPPVRSRSGSSDDLTLAASVDGTGPQPAARLVVSGEVLREGAADLAQMLSSLAEDGVVHVDVDLTDLRECTVADLVTLLDADRVIEERGGALRLICAEADDRVVADLLGDD